MSFPFDSNIKAETIAQNLSTIFDMDNITLEAEIITLQNEDKFWKYLPEDKNPNLKNVLKIYTSVLVRHICANQHFHK